MVRERSPVRRWVLIVVMVILAGSCGSGDATEGPGGGGTFVEPATAPTGPPFERTDAPDRPPRFSELAPILVTELPLEALDTLDVIANGGPFPFDRDGVTFENREGLLPAAPTGHYREYTVVTPGASTRGARRIVAGGDGELFYTDDHYVSFFEIVPED